MERGTTEDPPFPLFRAQRPTEPCELSYSQATGGI